MKSGYLLVEWKKMRFTKIIATLGPACDNPRVIEGLVKAGVNVFRLNLSHGTHEEHLARVKALDAAEKKTGKHFARLFDLQGPKIRVGKIDGGKVFVKEGDVVKMTGQKILGNSQTIPVDYPKFLDLVKKGSQVYIADGLIELMVTSVQKDYCVCKVEIGGFVGERKGVNVPNAHLDLSPLTVKDLIDAKFAVQQKADYIAQSFVRRASDILELRAVLADAGAPGTKIIAKIEDEEGVKNIDEIIQEANGIMVARGDLGVQIPLQDIPFVQKMIIRKTIEARKPVIVATQMLDSMTNNPTPTRAEVSDVANAIADGSSAVMLSGETAQGKHPVRVVQVMNEIILKSEMHLLQYYWFPKKQRDFSVAEALAKAVCYTAKDLNAKAIITCTLSGATARFISSHKPRKPILAVTRDEKSLREMCLNWGITPLLIPPTKNTDELIKEAIKAAKKSGVVEKGDLVVITAGLQTMHSHETNLIKVQQI